VDLATAVNAPRTITLESTGRAIPVRHLTMAEWGEVQSWIVDRVKDPLTRAFEYLARARKHGVAPSHADRDAYLRQADWEARYWPPRVCTATWFTVLAEAEGGSAFLTWCILKACRPDFTLEEAAALDAKLTLRDSARIVRASQGLEPDPPKDEAPTEGPTTTTGPTTASPPTDTPG
jgi:hypothetical protein